MQHAWILDVLTDLRSYAESNGLPAVARAAAQTLDVAETELANLQSRDDSLPVE